MTRECSKSELTLLRRCIERIADQPVLFDMLRWIFEAGFKGEKMVLRNERVLNDNAVLDLGCGTGVLSEMFNSASYLGLDINQRYICWARKVHPGYQFLAMDGQRMNLKSGSFDTVIIGGVIHHLEDEDARSLLSEAKRVLHPTGRMVLWEDVPTQRPYNWIGKLIQRLDFGEYIRSEREYIQIVRSVFEHIRHYPMSSGVCDYIVIIAQRV